MPHAERFLGIDTSDIPGAIAPCDPHEICCLCDEPMGYGPSVVQRFEADPSGTDYCAHAKCAHEYAMACRALRIIAQPETP